MWFTKWLKINHCQHEVNTIQNSAKKYKNIPDICKLMLINDPHLISKCIFIIPILKTIHLLLYTSVLLCIIYVLIIDPTLANFISTVTIFTNNIIEIIKQIWSQVHFLKSSSCKFPAAQSIQTNLTLLACAHFQNP